MLNIMSITVVLAFIEISSLLYLGEGKGKWIVRAIVHDPHVSRQRWRYTFYLQKWNYYTLCEKKKKKIKIPSGYSRKMKRRKFWFATLIKAFYMRIELEHAKGIFFSFVGIMLLFWEWRPVHQLIKKQISFNEYIK